MDLKDIKLEYIREELNQKDLNSDPVKQLKKWFQEALNLEISYPNAATLATVNSQNIPSVRIVLVKDITPSGLQFFTDYTSKKGLDMEKNSNVSLLFFWKELDRQVRITGEVTKLSLEESHEYFYSRPRESQISALASHQSSIISKKELNEEVLRLKNLYEGKKVEFPKTWGGYSISGSSFEFWQGRPNRLHDRFQYSIQPGSANNGKVEWKIDRLSP